MPDTGGGYSSGGIVGTALGDMFYFDAPLPEATFENSEIALRFQKQIGSFNSALYFYTGFYKSPLGFDVAEGTPVYPELNLYGASLRGSFIGGILWLEGGYYDSRQDPDGLNPNMPNSSVKGMIGFERQIAADFTANVQWQADYMIDYDLFLSQQIPGSFVREEIYHLVTSRLTKKMNSETVNLSGFVFYSPTDEDVYLRISCEYKYTDEITLTAGTNIFEGSYINTDFGQFDLNDNVYVKMTYGF
jgi:hypothetical protein